MSQRAVATGSRRAHPSPAPDPAGSSSSPEASGDASALVGVADAVEILREEKPDLREGLENRPLAVEYREAHARQLLPLALEHRVDVREARIELLALLDGALHDRRDQAVDGLPGAGRALGRRLGQRNDRHAELAEEALEQASDRVLEEDRRQSHPLERVMPELLGVRVKLGVEPLDVLAVLVVLPPVAEHPLAEVANHRGVLVALGDFVRVEALDRALDLAEVLLLLEELERAGIDGLEADVDVEAVRIAHELEKLGVVDRFRSNLGAPLGGQVAIDHPAQEILAALLVRREDVVGEERVHVAPVDLELLQHALDRVRAEGVSVQ